MSPYIAASFAVGLAHTVLANAGERERPFDPYRNGPLQMPVRIVPAGKSRTEWRKHLRAFEKSVKKRIKAERAALEGEQS